MKKVWLILVLALFMTGCSAEQTWETVNDAYVQSVSAPVQQVHFTLPENASVPTLQSEEAGTLYMCDGYTVTLQALPAGDLDKTLLTVTGFSRKNLAVLQTTQGSCQKYACVWTAAGEAEEQIGRACILDDGSHHYVLTAMAPASSAGELRETWQQVFSSFCLVPPDASVNTGS